MKVRLARLVVTLASAIVPRAVRSRWREEWRAELDATQGAGGSPGAALRFACGAPHDAVAARLSSVARTFRVLAAGARHDLVHTARALLHSPRHVLAVVASLGVGLTVSISVFSALNALLYGEIPGVQDRRTLARFFVTHEEVFGVEGFGRTGMVPASPLAVSDFEVLETDDGPAFEGVAAEGDRGFAVALGTTAAGTTGAFVSADYFRILGTRPHLGRLLTPSDHEPDAPAVAVIGFHLWRDRFGEPADIVGRSLSVGGRDVTIVGVAPPRFTGVQPSDVGTSPVDYVQLWLPLRLTSIWPGSPSRDHPWLTVMGRLTPGFTHGTAAPSLTVAASRLTALRPDARKQAAFLVKPHGFSPDDAPLQVLLIVALVLAIPLSVLAIACANVASLQLARVIDRSRELAVRLALGASRGQLLRLLTLDAVLLALLATSAGWLGAAAALAAVRDVFPLTITLDRHVVLFALTLAAGVVVFTGLAPAWLVLRRSTAAGLKQTSQSGGAAHSRLRNGLVVLQIAVSLILLSVSALFARSINALHAGAPAVLAEQLVGPIDLAPLAMTPAETRQFADDLLRRLSSDPRVRNAALVYERNARYRQPGQGPAEWRFARGMHVTPDWFATGDIPLVSGRFFQPSADALEAVVSARLARAISGDGLALGRVIEVDMPPAVVVGSNTVMIGREAPAGNPTRLVLTIVGVAADRSRRAEDLNMDATIYLPMAGTVPSHLQLRVRTADPMALAADVRRVVRELDPRLPWIAVDTGSAAFLREIGALGYLALSLGALGTMGLVLAAGGLYAVMSYLVAARRRELSIRLAIGADRRDVLWLVLRQAMRLAAIGAITGLAVSVPGAIALRGAFMGISPLDPIAWSAPLALLLMVAVAAAAWPAARAARIDPIRALRED